METVKRERPTALAFSMIGLRRLEWNDIISHGSVLFYVAVVLTLDRAMVYEISWGYLLFCITEKTEEAFEKGSSVSSAWRSVNVTMLGLGAPPASGLPLDCSRPISVPLAFRHKASDRDTLGLRWNAY